MRDSGQEAREKKQRSLSRSGARRRGAGATCLLRNSPRAEHGRRSGVAVGASPAAHSLPGHTAFATAAAFARGLCAPAVLASAEHESRAALFHSAGSLARSPSLCFAEAGFGTRARLLSYFFLRSLLSFATGSLATSSLAARMPTARSPPARSSFMAMASAGSRARRAA